VSDVCVVVVACTPFDVCVLSVILVLYIPRCMTGTYSVMCFLALFVTCASCVWSNVCYYCVCDYVCVILCGMTVSYAGCANVLIFATHCTTRHTCNTLYHTAPHYTTHTAPHSNTLQHTATVLCRCRKHGVTVGVRGRVVVESCSIFENTEHGIMAHAASSSLRVNRSR